MLTLVSILRLPKIYDLSTQSFIKYLMKLMPVSSFLFRRSSEMTRCEGCGKCGSHVFSPFFFAADFARWGLQTCCTIEVSVGPRPLRAKFEAQCYSLSTDNSGEITRDEVVHHIVEEVAESDLELDEAAIRESTAHLIRVVDTNKTNTIDFEEFVE